jgi:hypothetical protein
MHAGLYVQRGIIEDEDGDPLGLLLFDLRRIEAGLVYIMKGASAGKKKHQAGTGEKWGEAFSIAEKID